MKSEKKLTVSALAVVMLAGTMTSCATVFGGQITESQKRRPAPGEPHREVRVGALVADILLFPLISIPVDFATGAIYKPHSITEPQPTQAANTTAAELSKK